MRNDKTVGVIILMLEVILIALQFTSLTTTPVGDSGWWWGDESWLMSEYREHITSGVLRHPNAYGASVHDGNGVLFGSMWITSLVYGVPRLIFASADMVLTGRVVTAILGVALCALLWWVLKARVGWSMAALGVATLVSSTCFFLASHSARYDIITALTVLALVAVLSKSIIGDRPYLPGALLALTLLVTLHVSFLMAPIVLYFAGEIALRRRAVGLAEYVLPFGIVAALLLSYHAATTGVTLFGHAGMSGFSQNYALIPVTHPFSRSALLASLHQKIETAWMGAPVALLLFGAGLIVIAVKVIKRSWPSRFSGFALLAIVGYLLLETSRMSYLMYVLPLLIAVSITELGYYAQRWRGAPYVALSVSVLLLIAGFRTQSVASANGRLISLGNEQATRAALSTISSDGLRSPKVLCSRSSVRLALQDTSIIPITTHFMEFGNAPDTTTLRRLRPDYIMVWASAKPGFYVEQESRLRWLGSHYGQLVTAIPAIGFDLSRDYFTSLDPIPDTLLVFRLAVPRI